VADVEANKALIRRFSDEVWNRGNVAAMDELFASDYVNHDPMPGQAPDRDGHRRVVEMVRAGMPDIREQIEDLFGEGDRVVYRWTVSATHTGDVLGAPGTGRSVSFGGIEIYRVADGRIVERWGVFEQLALLRQLGVLTKPS
jgi:steroid delta-isomerase-like uncharacterized protein